jgi:hypothetical protein
MLDRLSREQQVQRIESLSRRGLGTEEIPDLVRLACSTVNKYRRDPEGERERARRERYRGRCRSCGRRTSGSDGPGRAPELCLERAPLQRRRWSDERLLDAIRDWTRLTGAPPTLHDWSPAHAPSGHAGAARDLAERGRDGPLVSSSSSPQHGRLTQRSALQRTAVARAVITASLAMHHSQTASITNSCR